MFVRDDFVVIHASVAAYPVPRVARGVAAIRHEHARGSTAVKPLPRAGGERFISPRFPPHPARASVHLHTHNAVVHAVHRRLAARGAVETHGVEAKGRRAAALKCGVCMDVPAGVRLRQPAQLGGPVQFILNYLCI